MKNLNRRNWLKTASLSAAALGTVSCKLNAETTNLKSTASSSNGVIRLSSNENRYAPGPKIKQAMIDAMDLSYLYSPGHYKPLIKKLAEKEGVSEENILLVSGSNEGLRLTGLCYAMNGGEIITSTPTYKALLTYAEEFGGVINTVDLDQDLKFDLEEMEKRVSSKTQMVFLCNPNNPTGTLLDGAITKDFCERVSDKTMVFSDEAYADYIEETDYPTMVPLVKQGKNVIVSRTFSKVYGMAGVRVGYLIARPDIIETMKPRVMGYVNMMGVYGAIAALDDKEFYNFSLQKNKEAKQTIYKVCDDLGLRYVESHTNFVFHQIKKDISVFQTEMMDQGVKVGRPFPPLNDWCRISTGNEEDMKLWEQAMYGVYG